MFACTRKGTPRPPFSSRSFKLATESLEDRSTPSVTVYNPTGSEIASYSGASALIAAIAAPTTLNGDTLKLDTVGGNTYTSPGTITKSLTILGPNDGVDPNTQTRVPEVHIDTTVGPLDIASGNTLVVRGLAFDVAGGLGAFTAFADDYSLVFSYNIVSGQIPIYRDVYLDALDGPNADGHPGYTSATITHNLLNKTGDPNHAAVRLGSGSGGVVADNVMLGGFSGVQLDDSVGTGVNNPVVTNNLIDGTTEDGIQVDHLVVNPTITFNTITGANASNLTQTGAITLYADPAPGGVQGAVVVTGNLITQSNGGVVITNGPAPTASTTFTITLNSISVNSASVDQVIQVGTSFADTVPASGNWFGTANPVALQAAITSPQLVIQAVLSGDGNTRAGVTGEDGFAPDPTTVGVFVPNPGTGPVSGNVQVGANLAASDGLTTLQIQAGTYPEGLNTTGEVLTLVPLTASGTVGVGTVTLDGNLTLGAGATVQVQITNSGYDQFVVNGTVTLSGATLQILATVSTPASTYTLIVNNSSSPVSGTFAGLAVGATVSVGGNPYSIGYAVGTGNNDVALTLTVTSTASAEVVGTTLYVYGTNGCDDIGIWEDCRGLEVVAVGQGYLYEKVVTVPISTIVVYGYGGNDLIVIDDNVTARAFLFAGNGNDWLQAGGGPSVLVGGSGNDVLVGGCGNDILIAGHGQSILWGGPGNDILIGGYTAYDSNLAVLSSILTLWNAAPTYAAGIASVSTILTTGPTNQTVFNNGVADYLIGGPGLDWYFANTTGQWSQQDVIIGLQRGEVVTQLS